MKHSLNCVLARLCNVKDTAVCNAVCPSYIGLHGHNGKGGRIGNANIPSEYRKVTLANSPARGDQAVAYEQAEAYARTFKRQFAEGAEAMRVKSVYLFSRSPGTGKTTTAAALLTEWITVHYVGSVQRGRQALERPGYFLDVNAFQTLYNGFNRSGIPADVAEPLAREYYRQEAVAKTSPFVVMDDIAVRSATDAFRADLHGVINERVTNAMPTVYTSNIPMSELATVFDGRLADRVRDMCVEILFSGESRRGMR